MNLCFDFWTASQLSQLTILSQLRIWIGLIFHGQSRILIYRQNLNSWFVFSLFSAFYFTLTIPDSLDFRDFHRFLSSIGSILHFWIIGTSVSIWILPPKIIFTLFKKNRKIRNLRGPRLLARFVLKKLAKKCKNISEIFWKKIYIVEEKFCIRKLSNRKYFFFFFLRMKSSYEV